MYFVLFVVINPDLRSRSTPSRHPWSLPLPAFLSRSSGTDQFQKRPRLPRGHPPSQRCHSGDNTPATATIERIPAPAAAETIGAVWEEEWRSNVLEMAANSLKRRVQATQFQVFYLHVIKQQPAAQVAKRQAFSVGRVYLIECRLLPVFKEIVKGLETEPR